MEIFPSFKALVAAFIFAGKGRVNYVGAGIDGVDPGGVGGCGIDSSGHDHDEPSVLSPSPH